jgi:hypothetical protein
MRDTVVSLTPSTDANCLAFTPNVSAARKTALVRTTSCFGRMTGLLASIGMRASLLWKIYATKVSSERKNTAFGRGGYRLAIGGADCRVAAEKQIDQTISDREPLRALRPGPKRVMLHA